MTDPTNRVTMLLLKNGVPFDIAESWTDTERYARVIIIGELNGLVWDWGRMDWMKPKD